MPTEAKQGTILLVLSALLGLAAFAALPQMRSGGDPAVDMAVTPAALARPVQPAMLPSMGALQLPRAGQPMQPPRFRQPVQPVRALTSPSAPDSSAYPVADMAPQAIEEPDIGRREAVAKAVAALGFAGAQGQPASAAVDDPDKKLSSGRAKLLIAGPGIAASWALFNILGPATGQLETMGDKRAGKGPGYSTPSGGGKPVDVKTTGGDAARVRGAAKGAPKKPRFR